jgi:hypothetical protein
MDDTDWSKLKHASGTSEHLPMALRDLASPDAEVRRRAYWKLDNYAVLQGSLYEVAPYVVRAIVETWPTDDVRKDRTYDLLIELANGDAPDHMQVSIDGKQMPIKRATLDTLLDGMNLFRQDLRSAIASVRRQSVELLLALSDHVKFDRAELDALVLAEPDSEVRRLLDELRTENDCTR